MDFSSSLPPFPLPFFCDTNCNGSRQSPSCLDPGTPTARLVLTYNFRITSNPKPLPAIIQAVIIFKRKASSLQRLARACLLLPPCHWLITTVFTASRRGLSSFCLCLLGPHFLLPHQCEACASVVIETETTWYSFKVCLHFCV